MTRKRFFQFRRKDEETRVGHCTRTARYARTIWKKVKLQVCGGLCNSCAACFRGEVHAGGIKQKL